MDARNLATVIAPNVMRNPCAVDPKQMLENIRPQTLFVRLLITHLDVAAETDRLLADEELVAPTGLLPRTCRPPTRVRIGPNNCFLPL